jgi:hypothetical protein
MSADLHVPESILSSFRERFAVTAYDEGGVLLDLTTGSIYRLNVMASHLCAALNRGEPIAAVEEQIRNRFGLTERAAAQEVRALLSELAADVPVHAPSVMTYEAIPDGFLMRAHGHPILRFDRLGCSLTYEAGAAPTGEEIALHLGWAVPQLLALQHQPVLHASAVQWQGSVLAFSGTTGSGKTTMATLFAAEGARHISQDLLPIAVGAERPAVFIDAEAALRHWVTTSSQHIAAAGGGTLDTAGLSDLVRGPTLPLRELLFLDRSRRSGNRISAEPLPGPDALSLLLGKGFIAFEEREIWRELLEISRRIAAADVVRWAAVPEGLESLRQAIRDYRVTSAS